MTEAVKSSPSLPAVEATCGCGHDHSEPLVLDVRPIPHAIRHAAVFGAFDTIQPGQSLVIIAPHAPLPLLAQLSERAQVDATYLVEGPTEWHVQITRRGSDSV
ncbi:MAG: DUF2249 domain-containing protein [bacterium]|nr:DUF2249 domain-containing protein [bacterium]